MAEKGKATEPTPTTCSSPPFLLSHVAVGPHRISIDPKITDMKHAELNGGKVLGTFISGSVIVIIIVQTTRKGQSNSRPLKRRESPLGSFENLFPAKQTDYITPNIFVAGQPAVPLVSMWERTLVTVVYPQTRWKPTSCPLSFPFALPSPHTSDVIRISAVA